MSLEVFTGWIKDLVQTNPASTDDVSQGDDHLRGIKKTLQYQFSGLTQGKAVTVDEDTLNSIPTVSAAASAAVKRAGDTMTGPLIMAADAQVALSPTTLQQVQAALGLKYDKTGGLVSGNVQASGFLAANKGIFSTDLGVQSASNMSPGVAFESCAFQASGSFGGGYKLTDGGFSAAIYTETSGRLGVALSASDSVIKKEVFFADYISGLCKSMNSPGVNSNDSTLATTFSVRVSVRGVFASYSDSTVSIPTGVRTAFIDHPNATTANFPGGESGDRITVIRDSSANSPVLCPNAFGDSSVLPGTAGEFVFVAGKGWFRT